MHSLRSAPAVESIRVVVVELGAYISQVYELTGVRRTCAHMKTSPSAYQGVMNGMQNPVPITSWSCFYDDDDASDRYFINSAPTFQATKAMLAAVLLHFQWKYVVLVVEESQRFYVDLAAHVTYAITDDQDFAVERVVHLKSGVTANSTEQSLKIIAETHARGSYV